MQEHLMLLVHVYLFSGVVFSNITVRVLLDRNVVKWGSSGVSVCILFSCVVLCQKL